MEALPVVIRAEYRGDFRIRLVFNDNVEGTVDFSEWLTGPVFEPLKDRSYFARFFIDGGTVASRLRCFSRPTLHRDVGTSLRPPS